jgi:hypothetical protein
VAVLKLENAIKNEELRKYEEVAVASFKESLILKFPYKN